MGKTIVVAKPFEIEIEIEIELLFLACAEPSAANG